MAGAPFVCKQFALATSGSTQDFTVGGGETRTPVAAYFHVMGATSTDTSTATHIQSWGATDGTNEWFGSFRSRNNQPISGCDTYHDTTGVIGIISSSGTQDALLSFNSFISGGVRLNHDDSPPSAYLVNIWFFFEGTYEVGTVTTGSTADVATDVDTTGSGGLVPRFLLVHEFGHNVFSSTIRANIDCSIGFVADNAGSGTQQATVVYHEEDSIIMTECSIITDNAHGSGFIARTGTGGGEAFVEYDFLVDGFSATPRNQNQAHYIGYLAGSIPSTDVWAGHLSTPAGTTGTFEFTEPGDYSHGGFLGLTALLNENFTTGAATEGVGLGMFTEYDQLSGCGSSDDNRATVVNMTLTRSFITASSVINVQAPPATTFYQAAFTASSDDGFEVNIGTGTALARLLPALLFHVDLALAVDDTVELADDPVILISDLRIAADDTLVIDEDDQILTFDQLYLAVDDTVELDEDVGILLLEPRRASEQVQAGRSGMEAGQAGRSGMERGQGGASA